MDDCYGYNHADRTGTNLMGSGNHGTHCAGTVAADSNNGIGVAGSVEIKVSRPLRFEACRSTRVEG